VSWIELSRIPNNSQPEMSFLSREIFSEFFVRKKSFSEDFVPKIYLNYFSKSDYQKISLHKKKNKTVLPTFWQTIISSVIKYFSLSRLKKKLFLDFILSERCSKNSLPLHLFKRVQKILSSTLLLSNQSISETLWFFWNTHLFRTIPNDKISLRKPTLKINF